MNHLMVDLETLGTRPTSIFLSLAAVQFDIKSSEIGRTFYDNISLSSAQAAGLTWDHSTLQWWLEQKQETLRLMLRNANPLPQVLNNFALFVDDLGEDICLWGNSASFDLGILSNGYEAAKIVRPWNHRQERCYRTIASEFKFLVPHIENKEAHNPVEDCKYQIKKLCHIWQFIHNPNKDYGEALYLLNELAKNNSPAVAGLRERAENFLNGVQTRPYQFEKKSSAHGYTEGADIE